jgi:hypothetical protein
VYKHKGCGKEEEMATGQLLATLNLRVVLSVIAQETTVSEYLLLEDSNFLKVVRNANTMEEVLGWVEENF